MMRKNAMAILLTVAGCLWAAMAHGQSFQRTTISMEAVHAFDLAAGDFDQDGDMDVAATGSLSGAVYIIENLGQSWRTLAVWYAGSLGLRGINSGDFDGDGDLDLIVAAYDESRFVLLQNDSGPMTERFSEHTMFDGLPGAWKADARDIDHDGDLDILLTAFRGNSVRVLRRDGEGYTPIGLGSVTEPLQAVLTDFDGDGDYDAVGCTNVSSDYSIYWMENLTPSPWVIHPLGGNSSTASVAASDLNRDGYTDIVTGRAANRQVSWWQHTPQGVIEHVLPGFSDLSRGVAVADFNLDNNPDIVASGQEGSMVWWRGLGGGQFQAETLPSGASFYGITIADMDRDGDDDVVVADYSTAEVHIYYNRIGIPALVRGRVTAELDGSGVADVRVWIQELASSTITDADGLYFLPAAEGVYTMRVVHPCWNTVEVDSVVVTRGDTTEVDFAVVRGQMEMSVTSLNLFVQNGLATTTEIPVSNSGDGLLTMHATASGQYPNDTWLTIEPGEMTLGPGEDGEFEVTISPDTSNSGIWDYYGEIEFRGNSCPDSLREVAVIANVLDAPDHGSVLPERTMLLPAYPNPFNSTATVEFDLASNTQVTLTLYDITGREARGLTNENFSAGRHRIQISGDGLAGGVYIVSMTASGENFSQKVLYLK